MNVGRVGRGNISEIYLANAPRLGFDVVAIADVDPARAPLTPDELLARDDVEVVLCLTPPDTHAELGLKAIAAGKHFYTEKPLATSVQAARAVLDAARAAGLLVGCAPDTFLGAGVQTLKANLDRIGTPAVAEIRLLHRPPEVWHPNPAFLYADLAGPLMDVGPYPVSVAIELFGPITNVAGLATKSRETGTTLSGETFPIMEPTRVAGVLEHETGVLTTVLMTFDAHRPLAHSVAIHGSEGSLLGGDPNGFDGPVTLNGEALEPVNPWRDNARGLGLQDLCRAIQDGTPPRASGERGLMVLETLLKLRR
jgi:predicted dehydrogenase